MFCLCLCLCAHCLQSQKKVQIPWDWSHRPHWAAMRVLRTKPQPSGRAARILILSDISLAPCWPILKNTKSFLCILNLSKSVFAFEQDAWSKSRILVTSIISLWNYYWYSSCPEGTNDNLSSPRCKCSSCARSSSLSLPPHLCAHTCMWRVILYQGGKRAGVWYLGTEGAPV